MTNFALAIEKLLLCYGVLLGYGVMVTLQILVLSFLVRVRVSQLIVKALSCYMVMPCFVFKLSSSLIGEAILICIFNQQYIKDSAL